METHDITVITRSPKPFYLLKYGEKTTILTFGYNTNDTVNLSFPMRLFFYTIFFLLLPPSMTNKKYLTEFYFLVEGTIFRKLR